MQVVIKRKLALVDQAKSLYEVNDKGDNSLGEKGLKYLSKGRWP